VSIFGRIRHRGKCPLPGPQSRFLKNFVSRDCIICVVALLVAGMKCRRRFHNQIHEVKLICKELVMGFNGMG